MVRSTEQRIRDEAGLTGNSNVTTTTIETYQLQCYNVILGIVWSKYVISALNTEDNEDFEDSQAESYLARVEELMAAGHVLLREYGAEDEQEKGKARGKIREAEKLLNSLFASEKNRQPMKLFDATGAELERVEYAQAGGVEHSGMVDVDNVFSTTQTF